MGIGLSIVFSGLCALVTDGATGSGQVVLVDTRSLGEVGGVALPAHAPTLVLDLASLVNPEVSRPDRVVAGWPGSGGSVGQVGLWDLTWSEVRVRVQGREAPGLRVFSQADGQSSWPEPPRDANDRSSWRDIRYVADMASITGDGRIDPGFLVNAPGSLPRGVAARIHLDDGLIEAGLPSREEFRDDVFEFASNGRRAGIRQALTDTLHWSHETSAETVVIEIAPVSGGPVRRLMLKPRVETHRLLIGNLPSHDPDTHAQHAQLDEGIAALHFGAYYELLRRAPAARPMPRLVGPDARRSTGGWTGPICPPARFTAP
jgi:hypothetical protein